VFKKTDQPIKPKNREKINRKNRTDKKTEPIKKPNKPNKPIRNLFTENCIFTDSITEREREREREKNHLAEGLHGY
jgi:hypothetical protein